MGSFNPLGKFPHRFFRVRRNVRANRLRIDHEQIERHLLVVEKVDDTGTPTFSGTLPAPPNFADSSTVPDNVASLGMPGYEINEGLPLIVAPNVVSLPYEGGRLCDGYRVNPHHLYHTIRHWRTLARKNAAGRRPRRCSGRAPAELTNDEAIFGSGRGSDPGPCQRWVVLAPLRCLLEGVRGGATTWLASEARPRRVGGVNAEKPPLKPRAGARSV
jgi:hypothetical protein